MSAAFIMLGIAPHPEVHYLKHLPDAFIQTFCSTLSETYRYAWQIGQGLIILSR